MTTYEVLDHIADSVNPILGLLALSTPWLKPYRASWPPPRVRVFAALACFGIAHLGQTFDTLSGTWPAFSLDYSGHSAVCVALLVSLAQLSRRWAVASVLIGIAYAGLMMYQEYHTLADIVTTATPVGLASAALWRAISNRRSQSGGAR